MSFKKIYIAGLEARINGQKLSENPYYSSENLPADTAAAYRAWQVKAETWESGWCEQERVLSENGNLLQGYR
ncbi:MAG TPA: CrpP-related protein [Spongiibacteraceae bacterium]|nr:CrpP-related protein [Spongiibacteraceae bacterium]